MPSKTRSHRLESEARGKLKEVLDTGHGWSVEDLHKDYGEDLLVRIFRQGKATPLSFYIQSKSTDSIARFRRGSSKFSVSLAKSHVRHWARFWEPVFITLYDSRTKKTYWECLQIFIDTKIGKRRLRQTGKTMVVEVPEANLLDDAGVRRIFHITKLRSQRYFDEKAGVESLISLLEEHAEIKVLEYNCRAGILILENRKGKELHVFFGRTKEMLDSLSITGNFSYNKMMKEGLIRMQKTFKRDYKTGRITILHEDGTPKEIYENLEDWHFAERVKNELRDIDQQIKIGRRLAKIS